MSFGERITIPRYPAQEGEGPSAIDTSYVNGLQKGSTIAKGLFANVHFAASIRPDGSLEEDRRFVIKDYHPKVTPLSEAVRRASSAAEVHAILLDAGVKHVPAICQQINNGTAIAVSNLNTDTQIAVGEEKENDIRSATRFGEMAITTELLHDLYKDVKKLSQRNISTKQGSYFAIVPISTAPPERSSVSFSIGGLGKVQRIEATLDRRNMSIKDLFFMNFSQALEDMEVILADIAGPSKAASDIRGLCSAWRTALRNKQTGEEVPTFEELAEESEKNIITPSR